MNKPRRRSIKSALHGAGDAVDRGPNGKTGASRQAYSQPCSPVRTPGHTHGRPASSPTSHICHPRPASPSSMALIARVPTPRACAWRSSYASPCPAESLHHAAALPFHMREPNQHTHTHTPHRSTAQARSSAQGRAPERVPSHPDEGPRTDPLSRPLPPAHPRPPGAASWGLPFGGFAVWSQQEPHESQNRQPPDFRLESRLGTQIPSWQRAPPVASLSSQGRAALIRNFGWFSCRRHPLTNLPFCSRPFLLGRWVPGPQVRGGRASKQHQQRVDDDTLFPHDPRPWSSARERTPVDITQSLSGLTARRLRGRHCIALPTHGPPPIPFPALPLVGPWQQAGCSDRREAACAAVTPGRGSQPLPTPRARVLGITSPEGRATQAGRAGDGGAPDALPRRLTPSSGWHPGI